MSIEETIHKLMQLKLPMMAQVLRESITTPAGEALTVEERIAMMVDREWIERDNRRTARRVKDAKLGMHARVEDLWCDPARGRDKAVLRALTTCQWVRSKQNVIITGLTGTGKSYLAAALAEAACRRGYRALRARVPRLLAELAVAHADGSFPALLQRLAKLDVLVLDDFLIAPLKDSERRDLLEVLEDRYDRTSTIITSQLPTKTCTRCSPTPPSQTRSATGSSTTLTCSRSPVRRSEKRKGWKERSKTRGQRKRRADHPGVAPLR